MIENSKNTFTTSEYIDGCPETSANDCSVSYSSSDAGTLATVVGEIPPTVNGQTFSKCSGLGEDEYSLGCQTVYVAGSEADVSALTSMGLTNAILVDAEKSRSESGFWDCFTKKM